MSTAQWDTLSWYDAVVFTESPWMVANIRARNPDIRLYFDWMPQNFVRWSDDATFWYPDTLWSLPRLCQFYARRNDWYLRDTAGQKISEWYGYAANWTRYCPRGTYGTARGLTYVEWLVQVAIPQVVTSGIGWPRWGRGGTAYDGIMIEILVDCLGSYGYQTYRNADPDRDGEPEGVYTICTMGGDSDSLSILYREMNEVFRPVVTQLRSEGVEVLLNAGNRYIGPSWQEDFTGVKLEGWMSSNTQPWMNWWEWFYGLTNQTGEDLWGPGYHWAETNIGRDVVDSLGGWDRTLLQVRPLDGTPEVTVQRLQRLGMGTALLGDGYYSFSFDQRALTWHPEYDWDLGIPLEEFTKETYAARTPADTLYVRQFTKGFVEVNPNDFALASVAAEDARVGFWQAMKNVSAGPSGPRSIRVRSYAPVGSPPVELFELRYSTEPLTPETWDEARSFVGNPIRSVPGLPIDVTVNDLLSGRMYYFAIRNRVCGRLAPVLSNVATAVVPAALNGDANGDGNINISDPVFSLAYLERNGPEPPCPDQADLDSSGGLGREDALRSLCLLFGCGGDVEGEAGRAMVDDGSDEGEAGETPALVACGAGEEPVPGRIEKEASPNEGVRLRCWLSPSGDSLFVAPRIVTDHPLLGFEFRLLHDVADASFAGFTPDPRLLADFAGAAQETGAVRLGVIADYALLRTLGAGEIEVGIVRFGLRGGGRGRDTSLELRNVRLVDAERTAFLVEDRRVRALEGPEAEPAPLDAQRPELRLALSNPYRRGAPIRLRASGAGEMEVALYNVQGQRVRLLASGVVGSGEHEVLWDGTTDSGSPAGCGVYYLRARLNRTETGQKLLLLE